ncbi:MAG: hypothetical protein ACTS8S_21145 [Giesbergeria sp.]
MPAPHSSAFDVNFFYARTEYFRSWKILSLTAGIALLVVGSIYMPAPDWDVPISLIMATCTYLTAPCSLRSLLERNWRNFPFAIASTWFSADGCYALYWHFKDPVALDYMRSANAPASLALYGICGVIWLYRGTLRMP